MSKKIIILLALILSLSGCSAQQTSVYGIPWWGWLIIILCIIIVLYINFFLAQKEEPVATIPSRMAEPMEIDLMDDLTLIEGIGPKIQSVLQEAGLKTYAQIAEHLPEEIMDILHEGDIRLAVADTWPEQAKLAAEGKLEELEALKEKLMGGRKN